MVSRSEVIVSGRVIRIWAAWDSAQSSLRKGANIVTHIDLIAVGPPEVVNAGSFFGGAVSPGEVVSFFGVRVGPSEPVFGALDHTGYFSRLWEAFRSLLTESPLRCSTWIRIKSTCRSPTR